MSRIALLVSACLLSSCVLCIGGEPCIRSEDTTVTTAFETFEDSCLGAGCSVHVQAGDVWLGPSFHISEKALILGPSAKASIDFGVRGAEHGVAISLNARCDLGTSLEIGTGSGVQSRVWMPDVEPRWMRFDWPLRAPMQVLNSLQDITSVTVESLRLSVSGPGQCAVDRVEYRTFARVCVQRGFRDAACYSYYRDAGR